ncbi:sensor histidine kinase [Amycolatopsis magusensis]|uniref:sensor histidine kinase n=1 Tax=Amycolatopsis magusensis TaxID=882444 RepID=UPI003C2C9DB9
MARRVLGVLITVLAVTACVISSIFVFASTGYLPEADTFVPDAWSTLSFLAAIGAAVMLCWRHQWPLAITGITLVPSLLLGADALAALVALAALAANRRDHWLWTAAGAVYAATALAVLRDANRHEEVSIAGAIVGTRYGFAQIVGVLVLTAIMLAIPLTVGIVRGVRGDLARREVQEQELRAEMTRRAERTRIAREMHDVLGHRLSLLSLQAGALEVTHDPESSTVAARTVRTTARQSLEDLRQVIGVLRDGQGFADRERDPHSPDRPQPTLTDLPELIAGARQSGLPVNATIMLDEATTAPVQLGTTAYRIAQEALTNVLRHAPGSTADVTVRGGPGAGLSIEVVNPLPATAPEPSPGSGTGLTGVSERVSLLGGNVSAGPTDERVFALRAWLPWEPH